MRKGWFSRVHLVLLAGVLAQVVNALEFKDHYSPLNKERGLRKQTRYILLHTTEGSGIGALAKLHRYGEAHYMVDTSGLVYRIIEHRRVAMHAGRSMWEGRTGLDDYAIGIEVVGHHNKEINAAQIKALRELLVNLKGMYKIPDENIIPHSMVAYGAPNQWHKRSHRGRKRCGMFFAKRTLREKLGLKKQPTADPDVKARRLVNADPYLAKVLFGSAQEQTQAVEHFSGDDAFILGPNRSAWDIARDRFRRRDTRYRFPDGTEKRGDEITNWKSIPAGTRVILSEEQRENEEDGPLTITAGVKGAAGAVEKVAPSAVGNAASDVAGDEILEATTIYFLTNGKVRQGNEMTRAEVEALPVGTRVMVGYLHGGYVTAKRSPFEICGTKWNAPTTYYRFTDGRIVSGEQLKEGSIPPMTMVFFQR